MIHESWIDVGRENDFLTQIAVYKNGNYKIS